MIAQVKNKVKDFVITLEIRGKKHYHIVKVCEMKNTNDISNDTKDLLAHAYQKVYDAFVNAFLAKGQTRGQSAQSASNKMYQIINAHENSNPVIAYLRQFNDSHYSAVAKKNMKKPGMDQTDSESLDVDMTDAIIDAINDFESAIADASPKVLCVLNPTPAPLNLVQTPSKQDFVSWLYSNPHQQSNFADLYRQYFLRQAGK